MRRPRKHRRCDGEGPSIDRSSGARGMTDQAPAEKDEWPLRNPFQVPAVSIALQMLFPAPATIQLWLRRPASYDEGCLCSDVAVRMNVADGGRYWD